MAKKHEQDEYLEQLWYMKEEGKTSIECLKTVMNSEFDSAVVDQLILDGLVRLSPDVAEVSLTDEGEAYARRLIRAHRIAERLLCDVLGGDFELGACEFEHTMTLELVDSICTLLGHPKECPHGMPIPEGECCKRLAKTELSFILPLSELAPGQSARIAYINCCSDQLMHRLEGLCLRPGVTVKLHQNYPAYVIECEGAIIALDQEVIVNISVWKNSSGIESAAKKEVHSRKNNLKGFEKFINFFVKK